MATDGIICQNCGIEAPTRFVQFHQNIGMLVMRQSSSIKANLCKSCVHSQFWSRTGITLGIGWLGMISLVLAPIFVIMNLVQYLSALGMEKVPPGAREPALDGPAINAMTPLADELFTRLNQGEPTIAVAGNIAARAGVTPGQVILYVQWRVQAARAAQPPITAQQPTYGFPVQPVAKPPPLPVTSR